MVAKLLLEHFCLTSATVIWVAGHGPTSSAWFTEISFCNSRRCSTRGVVDFWCFQRCRVSHVLLLQLPSGIYVPSSDFARRQNCVTWVLFTLHYPLDAVCLLCLFDRLKSSFAMFCNTHGILLTLYIFFNCQLRLPGCWGTSGHWVLRCFTCLGCERVTCLLLWILQEKGTVRFMLSLKYYHSHLYTQYSVLNWQLRRSLWDGYLFYGPLLILWWQKSRKTWHEISTQQHTQA